MLVSNKRRWFTGAIVAIAIVAGGAGIAVATGATGDDDQPLTGDTLQRATEAALAHTGGGTVTETEAGDDGAAYGVEVRLMDGTQVEVNLDAGFNVIGQEADDDGPGDEASDDDEHYSRTGRLSPKADSAARFRRQIRTFTAAA